MNGYNFWHGLGRRSRWKGLQRILFLQNVNFTSLENEYIHVCAKHK